MAIKKRRPAGEEIPRGSNHGGIKKRAVPNEKPTGDKDYQDRGGNERDAFERALDKANENKRRVKEVQMGDRKAQPKIQEGRYIAITMDAQLESNVKNEYGFNDRITIPFAVITEDYTDSVLLTEKYWASGSEGSRYCQILSKLLRFDPRRGFHIKDLIGLTCEVIIVHNQTTSNGTFANIADVKVISKEEDELTGEM